MERIEKTVFISYRRTNFPWALAVYQDLTHRGYDVFLDYEGIASGDFESAIVGNITSRAHFLLILTPSALERCGDPGDWLRREIETALDSKRNIVSLMLEGFSFDSPGIASQLTGTLAPLRRYNGLAIPNAYFTQALDRLRDRFLNIPLSAVVHPPSAPARQAATEQKTAADLAPLIQEQELTAQQYFERGLATTDLTEKLRLYTEAIRLQPGYMEALNNRGSLRNLTGDVEGAIADYNEAIRLRPDKPESSYKREVGRAASYDIVGPFEDYNEAARVQSDYAAVFYNRGMARKVKGDLEGALADYNESIRLKPDSPQTFYNRGNAHKANGDLEEALADYSEAIRLKPDYAEAFNNRGTTRRTREDLEGALADYEEAMRLKPDDPSTFYNRARIWELRNRPDAAIADLQQYLTLGGGIRDGDTETVQRRIQSLARKSWPPASAQTRVNPETP